MRSLLVHLASGLTAAAAAVSARHEDSAGNMILRLNQEALDSLDDGYGPTKCSTSTASVRRDWAALNRDERRSYIEAVQCLQALPSLSDPESVPGARSRYDDFVATHIELTSSIHFTGNFLTWHRYFVWSYEKALQNECGYNGTQPYWNWFDHQDDITKSPVYDGSDTSFGSTGAYVEHEGSWAAMGNYMFQPGEGGGCLLDGPFKDMVVNLGPVRPGMRSLPVSPTGPLGYNPHCLRRDLINAPMEFFSVENLLNLTFGDASHTVELFQDELQGRFEDRFPGMHSAGHYVAGGDATDVFSSPADPTFFMHHTMLDRLYWAWQALHPEEANSVAGTLTIFNNPPSRDALPSDLLDVGVNGPPITIAEAWDTMGDSPFCYIYL